MRPAIAASGARKPNPEDGIDVARTPEPVRRMIGISLQESPFFERLTQAELPHLFADVYGRRARFHRPLERVGLPRTGVATGEDSVRRPAAALRSRRNTTSRCTLNRAPWDPRSAAGSATCRATAVAQSVAFPLTFIALLSTALLAGMAAVTRFLPVSYITDGMQHLNRGGPLGAVVIDLRHNGPIGISGGTP